MLGVPSQPREEAQPDARTASREQKFVRGKQNSLVRFGKRIRRPVNRWFARQSLIGDDPILDPGCIPALAEIGLRWEEIRSELEPLLANRDAIPAFGKLSPDHRRIANSQHWKSFFFEGYGFRMDANCAQCPRTAEMLDRIPGLVVAFFSIMEPGTHVPRHRGLTKAWINCHLPLVVPQGEGRCEMQVGEQTVAWREGEWLLFDETNPHEVWNTTQDPRIVLFLQVRRPMTLLGNLAAKTIYEIIRRTGFVQDVRHAVESER